MDLKQLSETGKWSQRKKCGLLVHGPFFLLLNYCWPPSRLAFDLYGGPDKELMGNNRLKAYNKDTSSTNIHWMCESRHGEFILKSPSVFQFKDLWEWMHNRYRYWLVWHKFVWNSFLYLPHNHLFDFKMGSDFLVPSWSINFSNADHIDFHGCSQGSRAVEVNPVEQ